MKTAISILASFAISIVSGQESVNTSGGEATGSGGSTSYSVGQTFVGANSGTTGETNEGVQQVYTVQNTDGLDENLIDVSISLYPNPSTDLVNLKIEDISKTEFTITVTDANGKILLTELVTTSLTSIDFQNYPSGTYFVQVQDKELRTRKFKLIKQ